MTIFPNIARHYGNHYVQSFCVFRGETRILNTRTKVNVLYLFKSDEI